MVLGTIYLPLRVIDKGALSVTCAYLGTLDSVLWEVN